MRKRPLVVIDWDDTTTAHNTIPEKEVRNNSPLKMQSVGWKIPGPKGVYAITSMRCEDNRTSETTLIPKGCIRNIRRVE